ncbi:protein moonraker isoform 2-T2 [Menidia menidia]
MTAEFLQSAPIFSLGQKSWDRDWVDVGSTRDATGPLTTKTSQTKLLFNENIPACTTNRATHAGPPAPILIERLLPRTEVQESVDSNKSSLNFTTLSEEKLQAAVKLAKRDLRRRHRESLRKVPAKPSQEESLFETSNVELLQELAATPSKTNYKASSPKAKVYQASIVKGGSRKNPTSSVPHVGQSPPTRGPGHRQVERGKQTPLSNEIRKLQNELEVYIQKVEELANRGEKITEPLEPEEQSKLEIRRQKQAARSARLLYVLQQQVKEIQEDIERLRREKTWETKKSVAINRLAAAHRGALRALQGIIHQLSDLSQSKVPPHYKELGQLIRQLSLCSAKVEVYRGSAVPETALDILQKLETLESALSKQETLEKMQAQARPPRRKSPHHSTSPDAGPKGPSTMSPHKTRKPKRAVTGNRAASHKPRTTSHQPSRREVLRAGLQSLAQQRELREQQEQPQINSTYRTGRQAQRRKPDGIKLNQQQDAGFQQPTVSSRLRVTQPLQKEHSVPWIPTSPHSPPPQHRSPQRARAEPRCLFPQAKPSQSPPRQQVGDGLEAELMLSPAKKKEAQKEALQKAWLDKMTIQSVKKLNHLSQEEAAHLKRLRSEVSPQLDEAQVGEPSRRISPSLKNRLSEQFAERAAESAERLSEALLEDLLEDTAQVVWAAAADRQVEDMAQWRLQAPTLESMLLRMEEMQKDEDEVRRRFTSIAYSDPLFWDRPRATGSQCHAPGSKPASPQPIRLTKPVLKKPSAAHIVLEKPTDTGYLILNSPKQEASEEEQPPTRVRVSGRGTAVSVPASTLRNIRRYRGEHDAYLRATAHEAIGNFNPQAITDSLAEELLAEVLADVSAEFQGVVEEYAEAVFTSEFLQPIRSPPPSTLVSHSEAPARLFQ